EAEYERLFAENKADGVDMRLYGLLNEYRAYALVAKAESLYKQAIAAGIDTESQLLYLFSKTSRNEESIAHQAAVLESAPANVRNWQLLALAYQYANMYEKAYDTAIKGLERFPNNAELLSACGDACRVLKKYEEALDYHKSAVACDPDCAGSLYSVAFIYGDLGRHKDAMAAWENVRSHCLAKGLDVEAQWPSDEIAKLQRILESGLE
ncbi:MAG: hypothetical protein FWG38_09700, partial [Defluviitaleaceae bacterium]|nr:hypothetical protein [Defluviitaleaceae bacterium]